MLTCKQATDNLSAQIDGELPFMLAVKQRIHQFMCRDCRAAAANLRALVASLRDRQPAVDDTPAGIHADGALVEKIMGRLSEDGSASGPDAAPKPPQTSTVPDP